jgi:hypothetical protein
MIYLLFSLFLSACAAQPNTMQTAVAGGQQAVADYAAAVQMLSSLPPIADGMVYGTQAGASAWAINQAISGAPGTFIMLDEVQQVAVFIAPAARDGVETYWFYGFVDNSAKSIIDLCARLQICGNITSAQTMSDIQALLESKGFKMIEPAEIPFTVAALRAALRYMKAGGAKVVQWVRNGAPAIRTGGAVISDFLAVPVYMIGVNPIIPDWTLELPEQQ